MSDVFKRHTFWNNSFHNKLPIAVAILLAVDMVVLNLAILGAYTGVVAGFLPMIAGFMSASIGVTSFLFVISFHRETLYTKIDDMIEIEPGPEVER